MSGPDVVDLFAGPGGWDEGARMIGAADGVTQAGREFGDWQVVAKRLTPNVANEAGQTALPLLATPTNRPAV